MIDCERLCKHWAVVVDFKLHSGRLFDLGSSNSVVVNASGAVRSVTITKFYFSSVSSTDRSPQQVGHPFGSLPMVVLCNTIQSKWVLCSHAGMWKVSFKSIKIAQFDLISISLTILTYMLVVSSVCCFCMFNLLWSMSCSLMDSEYMYSCWVGIWCTPQCDDSCYADDIELFATDNISKTAPPKWV